MTVSDSTTVPQQTAWMRFRSRGWRYAALLIGLAIIAVIAYLLWIYSSARAVERMLDRADALDVSGIARGNQTALAAAQALVDDSNDATNSLSGRLGPLRVAEATFGWLPWAGDQLRAPDLLLDRAEASLHSTEPLVAAAEDFAGLIELIGESGLSTDASEFDDLIAALETNSAEASSRMQQVVAAAEAMDGLSLLGIFDRRADRIESLEVRLLAFGDVLGGSAEAIAAARDVLTAGAQVTEILGGSSGELDLLSMANTVRELDVAAQDAIAPIGRLEELVQAAAPDTELANFAAVLSESMVAVSDLSAGLASLTQLLGESAETLAKTEGSLLSDGPALQSALRPLVERREEAAQAVTQSSTALDQLRAAVDSGEADFLPDSLTETLFDQADRVVAAAGLLLDGPELLLSLMGAESPRKYMVIGQTSDELRAAGGFTSSVWTMSFADGALTETEFIPIRRFEDLLLLADTGPPPTPLNYYMNIGAVYLRDVGWAPDYPSVGSLASELYTLHRDEDVDGVIAVTQWGIIRLVEALGGVEVEGEFVSPDEILGVIEQGTDRDGTRFLEQIFTALIDSFSGAAFADPDFELFRVLNEVISRKDLMLFSTHADEQELIEALDLAGSFPVDSRDRLAVVDSNVGWSKSDRSIERSANYVVDLTQRESPSAELTLSYRNVGTEIGRDCSSQSPPHNGEAVYSVSLNSCYWNYLRAYVATGIKVTSSPDLPLPENSVPDQLDRQEPGSPTFVHGFDSFGDHLAGLVQVAAGDSVKFSFDYELPQSVLNASETGLTYELALVAQPGSLGRTTAVEILLPADYSMAASSHTPEVHNSQTVMFMFDLLTDETLRVELTQRS